MNAVNKMRPTPGHDVDVGEAFRPEAAAQAGAVRVGRLAEREGNRWWVTVGGRASLVAVDASVDPALLADARRQGARVLVEQGPDPAIVGVVLTSRPLVIDRAGNVEAEVGRFAVTARHEAILKTMSAFVRVTAAEAEIYGVRVIARARETAKILARMIALN